MTFMAKFSHVHRLLKSLLALQHTSIDSHFKHTAPSPFLTVQKLGAGDHGAACGLPVRPRPRLGVF